LYYRADEPEILTYFQHDSLLKAFSQPISLAYGRVLQRKFTLDIFQLMPFFYCINWLGFSVSVTVSVIFYFSVTVI